MIDTKKLNDAISGNTKAYNNELNNALRSQYADLLKEKPIVDAASTKPIPESKPLFGIESPAATYDDPTYGGLRVATPKFTARGVMTPFGKALNVISSTAESLVNRTADLFDFIRYEYPSSTGSGGGAEGEPSSKKDFYTKLGAKTLSAASGVISGAFAPVSAQLTAAEEIPVLGLPAKGFNWVLGKVGEAAGAVGKFGLNQLPISEETKKLYDEPIQELSSTLGILGVLKGSSPVLNKAAFKTVEGQQIPRPGIVGGAARVASKALPFGMEPFEAYTNLVKPYAVAIKNKIVDRNKAGEDVNDPNVAKQILNEASKEVPIELPGVMTIHKVNEKGEITGETVTVHTNYKNVLQNMIPFAEDLNWKKVDSLGKDTNGNQITARIEPNIKNGKVVSNTVYYTNNSTGRDLIHELGHHFDTKLASDVNRKMSDIMTNYDANKNEVNTVLTGYAVERVGKDATKSNIDSEIRTVVTEINNGVNKLAGNESRLGGEKFAEAIREVFTNPDNARSVAPEFVKFVEYAMRNNRGAIGKRIDVISSLTGVDVGARTKEIIKQEIKTTEESIANHPALGLTKYARELNNYVKGEKVSEQTAEAVAKQGFKNIDEASKAFQDLNSLRGERDGLKQELKETGEKVAKKKQEAENAEAIQLFSNNDAELNFKQAQQKLKSKEHSDFVKETDNINTKYGAETVETKSLIGDTKSYGTENSVYNVLRTDPDTSRKIAAEKGLQGNQLTVLNFVVDAKGQDAIITIKMPGNLTKTQIRNILNQRGLEYRSIDPNTNDVIIFSQKGQSLKEIKQLSKDYGSKIEVRRGTGEFIGSDVSRDDARRVYEGILGRGQDTSGRGGTDSGVSKGTEVVPVSEQFVQKKEEIKFSGEPIVSKAFREDKINAPDDVIKVLEDVASKNEQFSKDRRVATQSEIQEFALKYLGDVNKIKDIPASIKENIVLLRAAEQSMIDVAKEITNITKNTDATLSPNQKVNELRQKLLQLEVIAQSFSGGRTAAGQLLASLKREMTPGENNIVREMINVLKESGLETKSVEEILNIARKEVYETRGEAVIGLLYKSLLSGPSTFIKNAVSTGGSTIAEFITSIVMNPKEMSGKFSALVEGLKTGSNQFVDVVQGNKNSATNRKFENGQGDKVPYEFKNKNAQWVKEKLEYVSNILSATDNVFYQGLRNLEAYSTKVEPLSKNDLYILGLRMARKEGYKGTQADAVAKEYANNHPDVLVGENANQFALRGTYNSDPAGLLGVVSKGISSLTTKAPILKTIAPFTRVVANVVNSAIDYTPYGVLRSIDAEGRGPLGRASDAFLNNRKVELKTQRERHQELIRGVIGTTLMAAAYALAQDGKITGNGPVDFKKKQQLLDSGWRPNSVKVGETYVPINNFGPLALPLLIIGNAHDANKWGKLEDKEWEERVATMMAMTAGTITKMSFLTGISNVMDIVTSEDGSKLQRFLASTAGMPVPNLEKQVARFIDPTVYEKNTISEMLRAQLGITYGLKPKLNVFGEEITGDRLTQLEPSKLTSDPVKRFLAENELWIPVPGKTTVIYDKATGEKRRMTEDEYYEYVKRSGSIIKEEIANILDDLKEMDDEERKLEINAIVTNAREDIKYQIEDEQK